MGVEGDDWASESQFIRGGSRPGKEEGKERLEVVVLGSILVVRPNVLHKGKIRPRGGLKGRMRNHDIFSGRGRGGKCRRIIDSEAIGKEMFKKKEDFFIMELE